MLISNGIKCECYFPYGGTDRGTSIRPGEFSKPLPSARFINKLLQKDWQKGTVKVYLAKDEIIAYTTKLVGVQTYEVKEGPAAGMFLLSKGAQTVAAPLYALTPAVEEKPITESSSTTTEPVETLVEKSEPEASLETKESLSEEVKEKKSRRKKKASTEE